MSVISYLKLLSIAAAIKVGPAINETRYAFRAGHQICKDLTHDSSATVDDSCVEKQSYTNTKATHAMDVKKTSCIW